VVDEGADGAGVDGLDGLDEVLGAGAAVGAAAGVDGEPESPDEESLLEEPVLPAAAVDALEDEPRLSFL
jgi:hypothetical protein